MFYSVSHVNNELAVSQAPLNPDFCLFIDGDKHYTLNNAHRKLYGMTSWSGPGKDEFVQVFNEALSKKKVHRSH